MNQLADELVEKSVTLLAEIVISLFINSFTPFSILPLPLPPGRAAGGVRTDDGWRATGGG